MFDAISFAGGGNRCYWQGGFMEALEARVPLKPERVVGVSGGAFAAAYTLAGVGPQVRARVIETCDAGERNIDWQGWRRGEALFPVGPLYRQLLDVSLDEAALARIRARSDLVIMLARPPALLPQGLAIALGIGLYQLEKTWLKPVHPKGGRLLGFTPLSLALRDVPNRAEWLEAMRITAAVPPFLPPGFVRACCDKVDTGLSQKSMRKEEDESKIRFHVNASCSKGAAALDGGLYDNVPVEPLRAIEAAGGRSLVLLTRRYPRLPEVKGRVYVQPSKTPPVTQFDITNGAGIREAYETGLMDGEAFARSFSRKTPPPG